MLATKERNSDENGRGAQKPLGEPKLFLLNWFKCLFFFFCHFDLTEFFYWTEVDYSQEFLFKKINLLVFVLFCFTLLLSCVSSL